MPRAVTWSERRERVAGALLNRRDPGTWAHRACVTFGSPWLDLVLRAGAAKEAAEARCSEAEVRAIDAAAADVWSVALEAQARHRQVLADEPVSRELASVHARLAETVTEMEAVVADAQVRSASTSSPLSTGRHDRGDELRALREAAAEVERADRWRPR